MTLLRSRICDEVLSNASGSVSNTTTTNLTRTFENIDFGGENNFKMNSAGISRVRNRRRSSTEGGIKELRARL